MANIKPTDVFTSEITEPTDVFTSEITGAVLVLLAQYHDKYDGSHSLQYTLEDCLIAGIQAKQRSKEYSEDTKNSRQFKAAIAKDPSIISRPAEFMALCKKYGVGGTPVEMTSVDLKAEAEKIEEALTQPATQPEQKTA